ncbi:MAG: type transport system ATP-binding protein [Gaiellaceae bacterium]|nr:type transport system ATP-binding protein [Gaiellaceae bacterium]MDX6568341.1 type transport system ATP-binding protein [Gaiellales bacterium]
MQPSVRVEDLVKRYGARDALRGVSFQVEAGEVVALLGPNGAGKTTAVEILEGYRARDGGHAEVLGLDPGRGGRELRERIGIVLQGTSTHPHLSALEAIQLFAGYYRRPRDPAELIALVGLEDAAGQRVRTLSGGQRRRLDLALALAGSPELLFLDEPTTGFDPAARRGAWETIRQLAATGTTVLLTTHYLDEAASLADRVIVLRAGRIVAEGAPGSLGAVAAVELRFRLPDGVAPPDLPGLSLTMTEDGIVGTAEAPTEALHALTGWALAQDVELEGLEVRRPSLEDVYLELTAETEAEEVAS